MIKFTIVFYDKRSHLEDWYRSKIVDLDIPIYSSYDIRDSEHVIAPVDANLFPAGFNNICDVDKERASTLFQKYIKGKYGESIKSIALLTEEHTTNKYYFENVFSIEDLLKQAGYETQICFPNIQEKTVVENVAGEKKRSPSYG